MNKIMNKIMDKSMNKAMNKTMRKIYCPIKWREPAEKGGICRLRYEKVSSCMVKGLINLTSNNIQVNCGQSLSRR